MKSGILLGLYTSISLKPNTRLSIQRVHNKLDWILNELIRLKNIQYNGQNEWTNEFITKTFQMLEQKLPSLAIQG